MRTITKYLLIVPCISAINGCVVPVEDKSLIESAPLWGNNTPIGVEASEAESNMDDVWDGVANGAKEAYKSGTDEQVLGKCGRQKTNDGFKTGFVWKPKSDGAFKGAVAVLPERFLNRCDKVTTVETAKIKGKTKSITTNFRNKGDIHGRPVFISDGREGQLYKKNLKLNCGCRFWIINDPAKRND